MSFPDLAYYRPQRSTCEDVSLYGQRVAECYDDATLAVLADFPRLAKLELVNHHITRIPRGLRALRHAWIGRSPRLATLEGIEDADQLKAFSAQVAERCDEPPATSVLTEVGSYGLFAAP